MFISLWAHFCPHLFSQNLIGMMAWGAMWNSIVQEKYQKIHNIERSSLMAPNIEFYYLFFLYLSSLSLTHMTWANSCKRFIFRLKSIIFSFWHLWGIKLYLYLFYWKNFETKSFLLFLESWKRNYFRLIDIDQINSTLTNLL